MKRLLTDLGKNGPAEYDRIYKARSQNQPNWADIRRWKTLLAEYKGGRLADLGCLDSQIIDYAHFRHPGGKYWGIDTAVQAIRDMSEEYPFGNYQVQDIYDLKFSDGFFDYVVAGEVIEHLEDPGAFIKEAFRVLASGGVFAISTPLEEEREIGAIDKDRHVWSYSEDDVKDLVKPYGEILKIKILRSQYDPYKYCWPQLIVWCKKK